MQEKCVQPEAEGVDSDIPALVPERVNPLQEGDFISDDDPAHATERRYPSRTRNKVKWYENMTANAASSATWATKATLSALSVAHLWGEPPPTVSNAGRCPSNFHPAKKVSHATLAEMPILQDDWSGLKQMLLLVHLVISKITYQ